MSEFFNNIPEMPNANSKASKTTAESTESVRKSQKRMKKNNKLMKRFIELEELNMMQEQRMIKYESTNKNAFLDKLGDGVLKALPSVLISITPLIFASLFGKKNK